MLQWINRKKETHSRDRILKSTLSTMSRGAAGGAYMRLQMKRKDSSNYEQESRSTTAAGPPSYTFHKGWHINKSKIRLSSLPHLIFMTVTCLVLIVSPVSWLSLQVYNQTFVKQILRIPNSKIPGLWIPHTRQFMDVPAHARKVACLSTGQIGMKRALQSRGWKVIDLGTRKPRKKTVVEDTKECARNGWAELIWTKSKHNSSRVQQPWQRHSWITHQGIMSQKASLLKALQNYTARTGTPLDFVPETFTLPNDRDQLMERLDHGLDEPWVIKLASTDNGMGIAMVGPQSTELVLLQNILQSTANITQAVARIREELVHQQKNDKRSKQAVEEARQRSILHNDEIIVQRYVCNELQYKNHKFDLRVYFLIASVNPLLVFYHDGSLRVAPGQYNSLDFSSTHDHLTNLGQHRGSNNASASFKEWELSLKQHVDLHPDLFTPNIRSDPLGHIRNQIKSALAQVIASVRRKAFYGYPLAGSPRSTSHSNVHTYMENGFALMGADFIIDQQLNIYMTEAQSSPGLADTLPTKRELNDRLLGHKIDILEDVRHKQANHEALLPMAQNVLGGYELIYTDDFKYRYKFERKPQRGSC